jgi:hypothetical protein
MMHVTILTLPSDSIGIHIQPSTFMDENAIPYEQQRPQTIRRSVAGGQSVGGFEFTKRRKWDELLLTELPVSITIALSPESTILFTGHNHALEDLLSYNEDELLDRSLSDFTSHQDWEIWQSTVQDAVSNGPGSKFQLFLRLQRKASDASAIPEHALVEIRGHIHFADAVEASTSDTPDQRTNIPYCILAVAVPYPSDAVEQLNGFLQCKLENQRLQQQLQHLRSLANARDGNPVPSSLMQPSRSFDMGAQPSSRLQVDTARSLRAGLSGPQLSPSYDSPQDTPLSAKLSDDSTPPKRPRPMPQCICVTCGRTDSPEWRKGPQGPKTLCNACGLRWAKKVKKPDQAIKDDPVDDPS